MLDKHTAIEQLKNAEEIYVLMSPCTRMPYVLCDEETFDDEVVVYFKEEDIREQGKLLSEQKIPVQIAKVDQNQRLNFFANLYTMGVNAIVTDRGLESETAVQLAEFVRRPNLDQAKDGKLPDGRRWVENPGLHLTALYFMQELRRQKLDGLTDTMKEQQEEILADFTRGTFLAAVQSDGKGIPLLKQQNGDMYQPVFTDMLEFRKFNRGNAFKAAAVPAAKLAEILVGEAKGVVVNPTGINLQLPIVKRPAGPAAAGTEGQAEAQPQADIQAASDAQTAGIQGMDDVTADIPAVPVSDAPADERTGENA